MRTPQKVRVTGGSDFRLLAIYSLATREAEMTRKDYEAVARVFAYQMSAYSSEPGSKAVIRDTAERMSAELLSASKFTPNGNKSFKPEVFLKACGVA